MVGKKQKEKDDHVCLDDIQMKNIITAARADESGDPKRIKKACPKAMDFVQEYAPGEKKEKKEIREKPSKLEKTVERMALKKINAKIRELLPDTSGWF